MKGSLARFRFMAYLTGVGLLVLTLGVILKYLAGAPTLVAIVGPIHGVFYMAYLVFAFDLSLKSKWQPLYTLMVLLAGTIPFLSFVAERKVTHRVTAQLTESAPAA
jgi:integral membrane protein